MNPIIIRRGREGTDGLKTRMPRSTRFGLVILAALLVVAGGYTAYWFLVAYRIEAGIADWALSQQADKIDLSWHNVWVSGYPAAFRIDLGSAELRDGAITPSPELHIPVLSGTARPWDFADWRLAAPEGFRADFAAAGGRTPAKLIAQTADGVVSIGPETTRVAGSVGIQVVGEAKTHDLEGLLAAVAEYACSTPSRS